MHDREHVPGTVVHLMHEQIQVFFSTLALGDAANEAHEPTPPAKVFQLTLRLQPTRGPVRSRTPQFNAEWRAGLEREPQSLFDLLPVLGMDTGERLVVRQWRTGLKPEQG